MGAKPTRGDLRSREWRGRETLPQQEIHHQAHQGHQAKRRKNPLVTSAPAVSRISRRSRGLFRYPRQSRHEASRKPSPKAGSLGGEQERQVWLGRNANKRRPSVARSGGVGKPCHSGGSSPRDFHQLATRPSGHWNEAAVNAL